MGDVILLIITGIAVLCWIVYLTIRNMVLTIHIEDLNDIIARLEVELKSIKENNNAE